MPGAAARSGWSSSPEQQQIGAAGPGDDARPSGVDRHLRVVVGDRAREHGNLPTLPQKRAKPRLLIRATVQRCRTDNLTAFVDRERKRLAAADPAEIDGPAVVPEQAAARAELEAGRPDHPAVLADGDRKV